MIDGRHVSNVLDVRTFRGPSIDSDHFLVAVKVRTRISASRSVPSGTQIKLDVKKLRSQRTSKSISAQLSSFINPNLLPITLVDYAPAFPTLYLLQVKLG